MHAADLEVTERFQELLAERAAIAKKGKILSWVPHEKQWLFIQNDRVKRKGAVGGNQSGKTTLSVNESYSHAVGIRPYLPSDHPNYRVLMPNGEPIPVPNKGQMCGEDFPVGIQENLWPTIQEQWPRGSYEVIKTEKGVPRTIRIDVSWCPWADKHSSLYPYSYIFLHAYQQGRAAFQGVRLEWIFDDEPPPRDIFIEQMRGLIRTGGKWMGAMTCVEGAHTWIYDLFLPPKKQGATGVFDPKLGARLRSQSYYMVPLSMYDNVVNEKTGSGGLRESEIEEFKDSLADPNEIEVRVYGKALHLMGTEYGKLWDEDIHVVPDRERDPERCVYLTYADAHPTKPYAILWFEVNEADEWHVWAESYDESLDTCALIAGRMKEIECWDVNRHGNFVPNSSPLSAAVRFVDPLALEKSKTGQGLSDVEDFALNHDIYWRPWSRGSLATRIREVKGWLRPAKDKQGNLRPKITFAESCMEVAFQMPRFREKKPSNPDEQARTGKMVDVDADLVQCVIAAVNSGLDYETLHSMREKVIYPESRGWGHQDLDALAHRDDRTPRRSYGFHKTPAKKERVW